MPVTVRAASSAAVEYTAASITVPAPAGLQVGDLMVAGHFTDPDSTLAGLTAPSGWATIGSQSVADGGHLRLYSRTATSADVGATYAGFSKPANAEVGVGIVAFTGHAATTPTATFATGPTSTSLPAPSVTGVADGQLLTVHFAGRRFGATRTFTPPAGMTERVDVAPPNSWTGMTMATAALAASGASGVKTATVSTDSLYITASLVIAPATTGGGNLDRLRFGAGTVSLRYGANPVSRAYLGSTQIWP